MDKLIVLSWSEFVEDIVRLADKLKGQEFDLIIGISRGGLVAARLLSDLLGIKEILTLGISYYKGIGRRGEEPVIISDIGKNVEGMCVLLVDDVADTGLTLKAAVEYLEKKGVGKITTCTVYIKPWCSYLPDYYSRVLDGWIVFPYEHAETIQELSQKNVTSEELIKAGFNDKILSYLREATKNKSVEE